MIDEMRAHIANRADAPIGPAAPVEGMIDGVVLHLRRDTEKQIPVEAFGHGIVPGESGGATSVHAGAIPAERIGAGFPLARGRAAPCPPPPRAPRSHPCRP